jgi:TIR domain
MSYSIRRTPRKANRLNHSLATVVLLNMRNYCTILMDREEALELFHKILSAKHPNPEQAIKDVERRVLSRTQTETGAATRDIEALLTEEFINFIRATASAVLEDAERVFSKPGMPLDNRTKSDLKRAIWQEPARLISFAEQSLRRTVMGHPSIPRAQTLHGKFDHWRELCDAEIDLLFNAGSTAGMQQRSVRSGEFFEGDVILSRIHESDRAHTNVIDPLSHPTAFISYSWDDEMHKECVRALATRLRTDGIDVRLDHWHTVPGDQLPDFMEREIRENDYVLVICTPKYKTRSEARIGGVGYEGDIMTAEVLAKQNHRKFVPVLARGAWAEAAPSWLAGKRYVDLSHTDRYEEGYSELLTTILGTGPKPPPLGPLQSGVIAGTSVESSQSDGPRNLPGPYPAFLDDQPTRVSIREPHGPIVSEQRLSEQMELTKTDPRAAIRESWSELGSAILGAANVTTGNTDPTSSDIALSLKRLELDTRFSNALIGSIPELQEKARKVFYQRFAWEPSSNEAEEFVRSSARISNELGRSY